MMTSRLHSVLLFFLALLMGSVVNDSISVEVQKSLLRRGESTEVIITVEHPSAGDQVVIRGLKTEGVVHFRDTTVIVPPGVGPRLVISLPIIAEQELVRYGEYVIVAELVREECVVTPSVRLTGPGSTCTGSMGTGHADETITVTWEATGEFEAFQVVLYENKCGKYPSTPTPSGPTTGPTTTRPVTGQPTQPTQPAQPTGPVTGQPTEPTGPVTGDPPSTDAGDLAGDDILPLPPGWEWGPTGATWTGEGTEPPDLPPGWEWGPLHPRWTGEGQPVTRPVIGTSTMLTDLAALKLEAITEYTSRYSVDLILPELELVAPGDAYTVQVYAIVITLDQPGASRSGIMSNALCNRFSPENPITGETVEDTPCPPPEEVKSCMLKPEELPDPAMDGGVHEDFLGKRKINRD
ncbi:MAG: hypothetical protein R3330_07160, partial [Saprospiraceae bacterium]|nr:hypothetical protein [Saprospiraceae bacterium]